MSAAIHLTPAPSIMPAAGKLTLAHARVQASLQAIHRQMECREVLFREWPGARACKRVDDCPGYEGWCEDCLRWSDVQALNCRINRRAEAHQ